MGRGDHVATQESLPVDDEVAPPPLRRKASRRARVLSRTAKDFLFLFVFVYFGLPAIGGLGKAVSELVDVQPAFLLAGRLLQLLSCIAYSQMTRAALPPGSITLGRLFRIQMATKAVGNVLPAGSAASSAFGYRLLTLSGVPGPDAGFALATSSIGSAVVLNILLWISLFISIPLRGFNPVYVFAAVVGVILLGLAGVLVFGLMKGVTQAETAVRA